MSEPQITLMTLMSLIVNYFSHCNPIISGICSPDRGTNDKSKRV